MGCCPSPAVVVLLAVAVYLLLGSNVPDELLDYLDGAEAYNKDVEFLHHPFLAPVPAAQTNRTVAAHVTGKLPPELDGLYVRNGPNPLVRTSRYHWFDGDSLLHAVWLDPKTNTGSERPLLLPFGAVHPFMCNVVFAMFATAAVYGNAPPQTPSVVDDNRAGRRRSVGLGSLYGRTGLARFVLAALRGLLGIVSAASPITNSNANTAVLFHHGKLYALVEANLPYEVSIRPRPSGDSVPREPLLDSVGHDTLGDKWHYSFTAHPKVDPVTGELIFFGAYPGAQPLADYIQYGVADSKGNVKSVLKVPLKTPGIRMMHDCAFTEHFTLFLDFPLYLEPLGLASGNPLVNYYGEQKAFIGVLPRHATNGSDVKWYEVGVGGYVYHVGNAYEEVSCVMGSILCCWHDVLWLWQGDTIVVDMTYYKSAGGWGGYTEQSTAFQHPGLPWRFIINRKTGDVQVYCV